MTFPLMPVSSVYDGVAPTVTYVGQLLTTGDGFPSGSLSFSSGTKVIVLVVDSGQDLATGITIGGVAATNAVSIDSGLPTAAIWYLETSASGSLAISGSGGAGRSVVYAYEVKGYRSSAPFTTSTASSASGVTSTNITVGTSSNCSVICGGMAADGTTSVSASSGPSPVFRNNNLESATAHFAFYQTPAVRGPTVYTVTHSGDLTSALAAAAWK